MNYSAYYKPHNYNAGNYQNPVNYMLCHWVIIFCPFAMKKSFKFAGHGEKLTRGIFKYSYWADQNNIMPKPACPCSSTRTCHRILDLRQANIIRLQQSIPCPALYL